MAKINYTERYEKMLPKVENAFMTLSFPILRKESMIEFCEQTQKKAGSYLLSYEILRDGKESFSIEFEIAWGVGVLYGIWLLGFDWANFINK